MSVTISDVASRAGVSTSTVSKVINNNPTISAETTARVNAAIKELHYIPNSRAVSFAKGQAKNIVYLSTLGKDIAYENPHMFDIMCGVYHELTSHHYMMSLVDTSEESYPGERAISGNQKTFRRWTHYSWFHRKRNVSEAFIGGRNSSYYYRTPGF